MTNWIKLASEAAVARVTAEVTEAKGHVAERP